MEIPHHPPAHLHPRKLGLVQAAPPAPRNPAPPSPHPPLVHRRQQPHARSFPPADDRRTLPQPHRRPDPPLFPHRPRPQPQWTIPDRQVRTASRLLPRHHLGDLLPLVHPHRPRRLPHPPPTPQKIRHR